MLVLNYYLLTLCSPIIIITYVCHSVFWLISLSIVFLIIISIASPIPALSYTQFISVQSFLQIGHNLLCYYDHLPLPQNYQILIYTLLTSLIVPFQFTPFSFISFQLFTLPKQATKCYRS